MCAYCSSHQGHDCPTVVASQRWDTIMRKKLCKKCLSAHHMSRTCDAKCNSCNGEHHHTICGRRANNEGAPRQNSPLERSPQVRLEQANVAECEANPGKRMMTTSARIQNPKSGLEKEATVLIDTGSTLSIVTQQFGDPRRHQGAETAKRFANGNHQDWRHHCWKFGREEREYSQS